MGRDVMNTGIATGMGSIQLGRREEDLGAIDYYWKVMEDGSRKAHEGERNRGVGWG